MSGSSAFNTRRRNLNKRTTKKRRTAAYAETLFFFCPSFIENSDGFIAGRLKNVKYAMNLSYGFLLLLNF